MWRGGSKIYSMMHNPSSNLFKGDYSLYKSVLGDTKIYGEYGCGASTEWVLANTDASVFAVDASREWIDSVKGGIAEDEARKLEIHHVDLGELGEWGRPVSYARRDNFAHYTDWLWEQDVKPDTVLVDGRFRVCSFLTALKNADPGTKIIFDDYVNRLYYHVVEEFVPREDVCGRQCLFIVPPHEQIDYARLDAEIANFRHVMD